MSEEIPYYHWFNPAQCRPKPMVSKLEEAKRKYVLSTLPNLPDPGIPKIIEQQKRK